MPEANLFTVFTSRLDEAGITYVTNGSVAGIVYGQPRITHEIDLVVELHSEQLPRLLAKLPPEESYCPPEEVIRIEIARETRGHLNLIHHETGFKADIYPVGSDHLNRWAIANRRRVVFADHVIWLAPPVYVIIRKLQYYSEGKSPKHLADIHSKCEISPDLINREVLMGFIEDCDLKKEYQQVTEYDAR